MMAKNYFLRFCILLTPLFGVLGSCKQLNPPETIPAYCHIDSIHLKITGSAQGTFSNGINCAWVYVDNNPVGVFQLPCTFPIVAGAGTHSILVFAGITEDGVSSMRIKYPFYQYSESYSNLSPGQTITLKPVVQYTSFTKFHWMEDFEGSSISLHENKTAGHSDTNMFQTVVGAFEGTSGIVRLDTVHYFYEGVSDTLYLPQDGSTPVFLEFNYKSNAAFVVGMYIGAIGSPTPILAITPTSKWKKMYVNLQSTITSSTTHIPFYVYFSVQRAKGGDTVQFMLDNIKLLQ